ncbi:TnsA-like heteromeric transposase endonuclease subunit [Mycobacterium intracellulare]|uniref:TnsA-like heteromeric transposase endonuclease subunit n=1 Tax=Mycobacterium intracellulare TaxID=1767 RepID=UPI00044C3D44|nr:TnsA-like heteromeric transposase endonuclease subunit [Mycobacterium intracellulare]ETZ32887.1 tnsA endonuclease N terminal -containing domain protein [Mycobacterium intracellulare MIN_052511_1280]MCA2309879.1 TnsA-like heteromeric transposase endonuclease subunit [Mycobacterium intracellulare subsp. chimaera]MCA2349509.1 TnsA-like heteromeric transposase endonuclease subunit [Mycobacterium intracellulare subsp. chimaera]MDM3905577.1 TnsA-like heteromeric transposase endonuclease subunit [M
MDITTLLFSALESDHHIAVPSANTSQIHHGASMPGQAARTIDKPKLLEMDGVAMKQLSHDYIHASYKMSSGSEIVVDWSALDADAVARGRPWRTFPWYLGQRNYSGLYWCATERAHVGYESRLELSRLMVADFDPAVKRIASQPFWLNAVVDGRPLRRVPDYLLCTDTVPVVVDVTRPVNLTNPAKARMFDMTRRVVEARGWRYELATEQPRVEFTNIRFLSGYRRPGQFRPEVLEAVRQAARNANDATIGGITAAVGYPKPIALSALFHLLWCHEFLVDISQRIEPTTVVEAAS